MNRVLFLGRLDSPLIGWLRSQDCAVASTDAPILAENVSTFDFLVSFGYRHILKKDVLDRFPRAAVNCHMSLLPWNRGADPNYWSFADDTPKGVTVHFMNEGLDKGDIIAQREIRFAGGSGETLRSTYAKLNIELVALFKECWPAIRDGRARSVPQKGAGSYHRADQMPNLLLGWDTPVCELGLHAMCPTLTCPII